MKRFLSPLLLFWCILTSGQKLDFEKMKNESFSNPDSTITAIKAILEDSELDQVSRENCLLLIGVAYRNLGDFQNGLVFSDSVSNSINLKIQAGAFQNMGVCYRFLGDYEKSIAFNLKALGIYEKMNLQKDIAIVLNSLGVVTMTMGEYKDALKYYIRSMNISEDLQDQENLSDVVNNIAIIYANTGLLDSSGMYFRKGLQIEIQKNNLKGISAGFNNLGALKFYEEEFDSAIFYFVRALKIDKKIGDKQGIPQVMNNIAEVAILSGDHKLARHYLDTSILLAKEIKSLLDLETAYLNLAGLHESLGDYKSAFVNIQTSYAYRDSLLSEEKNIAVTELLTKYETEKKEQQIALQEVQLSEQQAQNQRNIILIWSLSFVALLLGIIILLVRNRAKKKQDLLSKEAEIKLQESLLSSSILSQENERKRFARDLHDGFGQMISVLNLNLSSLEKGTADKESIFENSSRVLDDMYKELKSICFNLMPETLIKNGVVDALWEFASRINLAEKVHVKVDAFGIQRRLPDLVEINLYRISQEWINNVIKYSDATTITVQITKDETEITLLIEDNGSGFEKTRLTEGKGNGWKNMQSRTNLLKGELELDTTSGQKGNTLILNVPIEIRVAQLV